MLEAIYDHTVHPRYLSAQSQVLDLGANYGLFAKAITARFGCRCIAVEPSPEPFAAIAETPLISKLQAAAASKSGYGALSCCDRFDFQFTLSNEQRRSRDRGARTFAFRSF